MSLFRVGSTLRQARVCAPVARGARVCVPGPSTLLAPARSFASESSSSSTEGSKGTNVWALAAVGLAAAGVTAYVLTDGKGPVASNQAASKVLTTLNFKPTVEDYQKVYNAIAADLEKDESYDDGSYGPVLVRLAWHASGTYDAKSGTGGSNGATMRHAPESGHGANAGLLYPRAYMEQIHNKFPWISYSDLWTLGGVAAIQEMGGPHILWRPGRVDRDEAQCTPDGRLPDGSKGSSHIRDIFYRMGFNDQEIVALAGAHALGRCHTDRSGFDGPWQHAPTSFSNAYFDLLLNEKWQWRNWDGPKQYADKATGKLMMLPSDMALIQDKSFRKYVEKYAKSEDAFFEDFSKAFAKLLELGVPDENFKQTSLGGKPITLKTTAEQDI